MAEALAPAQTLSTARVLASASVRGFSADLSMNLLRVVAQALNIAAEGLGAWFLLDRAGGLGGWSTAEVLVLFGIAEMGLGLGMLVAEPLEPPTFSQLLRDGRFDQALTRPFPPWLWVVATDVQVRNCGRIAAGTVITVGAAIAAGVPLSVANVALVGLAAFAMGAVVAGLLTIGAAFTMWTIEGSEILNAFTYGGATLAGWPLQIYAGALRAVFLWAVPVGAAVYVPTLFLVDRQGPPGAGRSMLVLLPALVAAFCAVAAGIWRAGLRHYTGTGS